MVTVSTRLVRQGESMVLLSDASGRGPGTRLTVKAGSLSLATTTSKGTYYESDLPIELRTLGVNQTDLKGGLFVPANQSKPPALFWQNGGSRIEVPSENLQFEKRSFETEAPRDKFRRELVYSGVSQGTISISYREFTSDQARPAFSQELKYDLREGTEISFRGARIQVLKADNLGIRFRVQRPLSLAD